MTPDLLPAVGCVRVSTAQQEEMYGPQRQRQEIIREAERVGLRIVEWVEEAISGANHERAADNRYFDLARQTPGLNFIFSHPNRVGRHIEVTVGIARTIHQLGGTVWIAGLGNLRDRNNWNFYLYNAVQAENDHTNIIHQLVTGKRSKALAGRWPHGAPPWGYTLDRDHRGRSTLPVPDENAAAVRRCADLSETFGGTVTARTMRQEGWPAPTPAGWTLRTVANVISNERYTGRAVFQGITLDYEPIIPREQWERLQGKRKLRKRESGPRDTSLLWSGHVRCAECGGAIGRVVIRTPYASYTYYRCWRSKRADAIRHGMTPCEHRRNYPAAEADIQWWAYLAGSLTDPACLPDVIPVPAPPAPGIPPLRLAELEAHIARAWEPYAAGKVTQAVAERLAAPYMQELERLKAEYAPKPAAPAPDLATLAAQFASAMQNVSSFDEQRELLDILEVRLYVGPDGPVRVTITPING